MVFFYLEKIDFNINFIFKKKEKIKWIMLNFKYNNNDKD